MSLTKLPARESLVTSRLGTGKRLTFFYSVVWELEELQCAVYIKSTGLQYSPQDGLHGEMRKSVQSFTEQ
jgi:hypothetical protein